MQQTAEPWKSAGDGDAAADVASMRPECGWLSHGPLIFSLIALYLGLHFVLRLLLSPTLGIDDAEQILFAQQWAFGYRFRQPPLFTWLLFPVVQWLGPSVLAVSIIRYVLLAATYGFLYLAALRWIDDRRLAALSVFSFSLIYVFAYFAHHDLTHTTALGAMIAASLFVFTKLSEERKTHHYLLLGVCFGLGMLAKWNFVMLAAGLPLTCLLLPDYRSLVWHWKSLLTIAAVVLIVSPTALWMFDHGQTASGVSSDILSGIDDPSGIEVMFRGGAAMLTSLALFPMPFLLIFLALFGRTLVHHGREMLAQQATGSATGFLGWLMLVILGLHVLLILMFGAVNFTERWMHPALMVLPIYLFARLSPCRPSGKAISFYLGVIAIFVAVAIGARLYRYAEGADECGKCREFAPFAALAADLRAAGFESGTIVADGMHIGGNLRVAFPESRIIDPAFPLVLWPSGDDLDDGAEGMCLLVWRDDRPDATARREAMLRFASDQLNVPASFDRESGRAEAMLLRSSKRRYGLGFELIRENRGGCR
ncbi:MAG: ArnT family glycosyltransferase [Geminicoccaceae bacterium]